MSGLVEKLEAAEVGSRELDALMHVEVANDPNTCVANSVFSFRDGWYCTGADMVCLADPVTTSLDAALALADRVIAVRGPIDISIMGSAQVVILDADPCRDAIAEAYGNTPALALCIAICRALNLNETRHAE